MLIKSRLYVTNTTLVVLTIIVMWIAMGTFASLSALLQQMVDESSNSAHSARKSSQEASAAANSSSEINQQILKIVDSIQQTNQTAKLTSKKVQGLSESLKELIDTIETLSTDVTEPAAIAILQEVSDEISDIEERMRREALINIVDSAKHIADFSQQIIRESEGISQLNHVISELSTLASNTAESSLIISQQAEQSRHHIAQQRFIMMATLAALALVAIISGLLMIQIVIRPITSTVTLMEDVAEGEGDLTQRLEVKGHNEMSKIASAFNRFVGKVQSLISSFTSSTQQLKQTANQTYAEMQTGYTALQKQLNEIEQIATAVEQMNATSQSVAQNAVAAANATTHANEQLVLGKTTVGDAQGAVSQLVNEVERAVQVITELSEKSLDINRVVDVITTVASQTNLLALNAAIEAARAGEQGRGFAVVADEVRTLASKAESSANDIRAIIEQVQDMTHQAVKAMHASQQACHQTVTGTQQVFQVLERITVTIQTIDDMNAHIASAAEQETAVSEDVNKRIVAVNQFSHETSEGIKHTVTACEKLNAIADQVHQQLTQFKV